MHNLSRWKLSFILLIIIVSILGGGYLFFYVFAHIDCTWSGKAQAWLDKNENGKWDADELPLANVRFFIDDTRNGLTDVGDEAISNEAGVANLFVWLPGCPRTAFEITAESPPNHIPTTATRLVPNGGDTFSFGFIPKNRPTATATSQPTPTPIPHPQFTLEGPRPVIVWVERDPWRTAIGSDSPSFAIYEDGQVIFIKDESYVSVMLSETEKTEFLEPLPIGEEFFDLEDRYELAQSTDQPTHELIVWQHGNQKSVSLYGDYRDDVNIRLEAPTSFRQIMEAIIHYDNEQAVPWMPEEMELLIWPYDSSNAMIWPEGWPDLTHPTTWYRGDDSYSIYLDWPRFEQLQARLDQEAPSTLLINGKTWSYSYRYPFINEHLWMHKARLNAAPIPTPTPEPVAILNNGTTVILPANTVERWDNSWTPIPKQIRLVEAALIPFLKTADDPWLKPDPPIWERLPDYKRQYLGLIEDGQPVIYGNYFCQIDTPDWQTTPVEVDDGGDCYFQIKFNVKTETIYWLNVNGEA